MRRFLAPSLAVLLCLGGVAPLPAADPAPAPAAAAAADQASPESAVLAVVKVLRGNDLAGFFSRLPPEEQAKVKADWAANQAKAQANPNDSSAKQLDALIAQLTAPDAEAKLLEAALPKLAEMDPQQLSQQLQMGAMMLPMLLQQAKPGMTQEQMKGRQALATLAGGVLTDLANWIPQAGINDPAKLKLAIHEIVSGAQALKVSSGAELRALEFEAFLARVSPMFVALKKAMAVYDLQADQFLDSITAKASGTGDARTLQVGFTAFGNPRSLPVPVVRQPDGKWTMKENAFGDFSSAGGPPGMDGGDMGGPGMEAGGAPEPGGMVITPPAKQK